MGVDRSTVLHTCRVAKQGALDALAAAVPGRPGQSAEAARIAELSGQVDRLRAALAEQAVALHLHEGYVGDDCQEAVWVSSSVSSRSNSC